jgi:HK97 family phage portal protein
VERRRETLQGAHRVGQTNLYGGDDVLHITGLSLNGLIGESVISRCRNTFGTVLAREDFEGGFYGRGATVRGVIQHPQRIGDDAIKNLRESWTAIFGGSKNAHQTVVLEEGAQFAPISMPLSDMEFVAAQQLSRTDIAVMFKLPPAYLGGSTGDSLTYATVEANQVQFATNAVAPWANVIAKAVGSDPGIFPFQSWYPEFVLEGIMRGDHGSRAAWYKSLAEVRAITPNEIRERENMPPLPDGDVVGPPAQERITETAQLQPDGTVTPTPPPTNTLVPAPANGAKPVNGRVVAG